MSAPRSDYARLSERAADGPVHRVRRWAQSLTGTDETPDRLARARTAAQAALSTGRRISVLGAGGGAGTTTVAVLLARTLGAARGGGVALVADDDGSVGWRMLDPGGLTVRLLREPTAGQVRAAVAEHGRRHAVTVVDCGRSWELARAAEPHLTIVVARHTVRGRELVGHVGAWLAAGHPLLTVLREVPDSGLRPGRPGVDAASAVIHLPHDRHVAAEAALDPALLAEPTEVAVEELAGVTLMRAVLG